MSKWWCDPLKTLNWVPKLWVYDPHGRKIMFSNGIFKTKNVPLFNPWFEIINSSVWFAQYYHWTIGKGLAEFWHGFSVHVFVLEWN